MSVTSPLRTVVDTLEERGLVHQITETDLPEAAATPLTVYCGFDPTAPSLHAGHMIQLILLAHFQRHGHRAIALVGGGTGLIGDPSGRSEERKLLSTEETAANVERLRAQIGRFLAFEGENPALMVDNMGWLGSWRLTEFLRDIGKHFTVNAMLAKDAVRMRLEDREQGISFTEFSYMLLQAADFLQLHTQYGCTVQVGGSDQWGNITAGVELIRRAAGQTAHGLTSPLLTTSTGEKFGKSAGNALWLDPAMTSPYQFYQFWINTDDRDVVRYLKVFTTRPLDEIAALEEEVRTAPQRRQAQRLLAEDVTALVHGPDTARSARTASEILFGTASRPLDDLFDAEVTALVAREVPTLAVERARLETGIAPVDALAELGLVPSRSQARQLIAQGGLYVNGKGWTDLAAPLSLSEVLGGRAILIRAGKKNYGLITV